MDHFCIAVVVLSLNFNLINSQQYSQNPQFRPSFPANDHPPNIDYNNFQNTNSTQNFGKFVYNENNNQDFNPSSTNTNNRLPVQAYGNVAQSSELGEHNTNNGHNGHNRYIPSVSKSISGDYCWDPLFSCDTANTILYCVNARCTCPTGWTIAPGNLPLNTVWHPTAKRCVSLIGSGCHTASASVSSGYVYCQPGIRCISHPKYREVGTCGGDHIRFTVGILLATYLFQGIF